jgi:hypothetical protein
MTTVFDNCVVMKDKEGVAGVHETLDKLDEMLGFHGIKHSFVLPHGADIKKNPNSVVTLNYSTEDDMTVSLVYALFCKVYRHADDNMLAKALTRIGNRYSDMDFAEGVGI